MVGIPMRMCRIICSTLVRFLPICIETGLLVLGPGSPAASSSFQHPGLGSQPVVLRSAGSATLHGSGIADFVVYLRLSCIVCVCQSRVRSPPIGIQTRKRCVKRTHRLSDSLSLALRVSLDG